MKRLIVGFFMVALLVVCMTIPAFAAASYGEMYAACRELLDRGALPDGYNYFALMYTPYAYSKASLYAVFAKSPTINLGDDIIIYHYRDDQTAPGRVGQYIYDGMSNASTPQIPCIKRKFSSTMYPAEYYVQNHSTAQFYDYQTAVNYCYSLSSGYHWLRTETAAMPSTTALQNAINQAAALTNIGYTQATWDLLQQRISEGRTILARGYYTAATLSTATANINSAKNALKVAPNPAALQSLVAECEALTPTDYTSASWNTVNTQLVSARNVLGNASHTQAQLDAAKTSLQNAKNNLVRLPDREPLRALVAECEGIQKAGYTSTSWVALQSAITAARQVLTARDYTQAQISTATTNLNTARNGLALLPDSSGLRALLSQCRSVTNDDYTPTSWGVFQSAITAAESLLLGDYSAAQIENAYTTLQSAYAGLRQMPNISRLQTLVAACELIQNDNYMPSSWAAFSSALAAARDLMSRPEYTEQEVTTAYDALDAARDDLTRMPDPATLRGQVNSCKAIIDAGYRADTWNALQTAIRDAESLLARPEYTAAELRDAVSALQAARSGLVLLPSPSGLRTMIAQAAGMENKGYSESSWERLQSAVSRGQALLVSGSYSEAEIMAAVMEIDNAIVNLQGKMPEDSSVPDGHRYLVDGVLPRDLLPAQDAIFENFRWGQGAGIWVFALLITVFLGVKIIRGWVGVQGEARFLDLNSPGADSRYEKDSMTDRIRVRKDRCNDARGIR